MTVIATPYGRDTYCTNRLRPGRVVEGVELVGQAIYRRLTTRRGTLLDDPNYGIHLLELLGSSVSEDMRASYPGRIRNECAKEPRVDSVTVTITENLEGAGLTWTVDLDVLTTEGDTFDLVLSVSDVTVDLLQLEPT
jgi:phage baseplate assembly protein W